MTSFNRLQQIRVLAGHSSIVARECMRACGMDTSLPGQEPVRWSALDGHGYGGGVFSPSARGYRAASAQYHGIWSFRQFHSLVLCVHWTTVLGGGEQASETNLIIWTHQTFMAILYLFQASIFHSIPFFFFSLHFCAFVSPIESGGDNNLSKWMTKHRPNAFSGFIDRCVLIPFTSLPAEQLGFALHSH